MPYFKLPSAAALFLAALALPALSGCGQRGPLFLPGQPAQAIAPTFAQNAPPSHNPQ